MSEAGPKKGDRDIDSRVSTLEEKIKSLTDALLKIDKKVCGHDAELNETCSLFKQILEKESTADHDDDYEEESVEDEPVVKRAMITQHTIHRPKMLKKVKRRQLSEEPIVKTVKKAKRSDKT